MKAFTQTTVHASLPSSQLASSPSSRCHLDIIHCGGCGRATCAPPTITTNCAVCRAGQWLPSRSALSAMTGRRWSNGQLRS
jgi:hypothetical protein